jgi:hypothetical protein
MYIPSPRELIPTFKNYIKFVRITLPIYWHDNLRTNDVAAAVFDLYYFSLKLSQEHK